MSDRIVLRGSLGFVGLADLFQILGGNNSTGMLSLKSRFVPAKGTIYFQKGSPMQSACGSLSGAEAVYSLFGWADGEFEFHESDVQMPRRIKQSGMELVLDGQWQ